MNDKNITVPPANENQLQKKRCTHQKQAILDTLTKMGSHVSAGAIYKELNKTHANIGRATVFRVLSDMADDGSLLRIKTVEGEDRYDITNIDHCHIICRKCGKVADVWFDDVPRVREYIRSASDFTVEKTHIEFIGLCKECSSGGNK